MNYRPSIGLYLSYRSSPQRSTMNIFWNFVEFSSDPACGLALLGVQGAEWDLLGLDCPDLGAGALGQRSNNKIQQTKTNHLQSKNVLKICAETSFFRRRCPRVLTYKLKLKKSKLVRQPKRILICYFQFLFCRFLDSTVSHVHPPSPPSHRGRATRSVSSWSCWADQTLPSRWEAWWCRAPQNDIRGDVCNKQVIRLSKEKEGQYIYICMYKIVNNCLNFLCAEKQADIDNDRKMQSFCISPLPFRRSWCALGRKVSVKLSSFGTKPSKFCLTVGKNAGMWCHSLLVTGIFPGQVCDACRHSDVLLTFPMVRLMVSMHLNSCPANKSSALSVCRGLTQEN